MHDVPCKKQLVPSAAQVFPLELHKLLASLSLLRSVDSGSNGTEASQVPQMLDGHERDRCLRAQPEVICRPSAALAG